jgi:hypothetical protein
MYAVQVIEVNPVSGTCYDVTMLRPTFKVPFSQVSCYSKPSEWNVLRRYDVTTYFQSPFLPCTNACSSCYHSKPSEWNVLRRYNVTTYFQSLFLPYPYSIQVPLTGFIVATHFTWEKGTLKVGRNIVTS